MPSHHSPMNQQDMDHSMGIKRKRSATSPADLMARIQQRLQNENFFVMNEAREETSSHSMSGGAREEISSHSMSGGGAHYSDHNPYDGGDDMPEVLPQVPRGPQCSGSHYAMQGGEYQVR